ncbi:MAG TPA: hypothetical protein PKE41_04650 [Candidatus Macondimonas sp.]|nr:hypothetical protein [Candidatus Macondimonas sp.]
MSDPMQNPWLALPKTDPRVLPSDAELLYAFNQKAAPEYKYDLSLFPEPYFGSRTASVVVLNLNPGWSEEDAAVHARPEFATMARASLRHALEPYPFLHLQPGAATPGGIWWHQRVRRLVEDVKCYKAVAKGLGCVQYMPYHSQKYHPRSPALPSQQYSFALVREAIARKAEIVILRSGRLWLDSVPELERYDRCHYGANPRSPYLSPGNLGGAYDRIVSRLREHACLTASCPQGRTCEIRLGRG